jgi:tetratricopeptide (TPR) repeat protein
MPALSRASRDNAFVMMLALAAFLSHAIIAAISLLPRSARIGHATMASDGKLVVDLLRGKDDVLAPVVSRIVYEGRALLRAGRYQEAEQHFEEALRDFPERVYFFPYLLRAAQKARGPAAALERYRAGAEALESSRASHRAIMAWVDAIAAWSAVLADDPALLPLADRLSQQAIVVANWAETHGARGAVLARRGQQMAAVELLRSAVRAAQEPEDKAAFARFLAEAERGRGNLALAEEIERYAAYASRRLLPGADVELGLYAT